MTEVDSTLGGLRGELQARVAEKSTKLLIPKTRVVVEYRAVSQKELSRIKNRFLPAKKTGEKQYSEKQIETAGLKVNTALLGEACLGIYLQTESGLKSADPDGPPPTFDGRLLELLGEETQETQSDIVRLLYTGNDFDIASAVNSVLEFSGGAEAEVYEDAAGN